MPRPLGRVLVGGKDRGAGFAVSPRLVIIANHVVRGRGDKPVMYVPSGGGMVGVERVQPDVGGHDAAILWLVSDVEFLRTSAAVGGADWRVESPPGGNDPQLHGIVRTARMTIQEAGGEPVEMVQLEVREQLGDFGGYSGSAVLDALGRAVLALLVEQKPLRTAVALGERRAASNVLYAIPIGDVIAANGLPVRAARPLRFDVKRLLPPGMISRVALLNETVDRVIGARGDETGAGLVLLGGFGGRGKTILARQAADDTRVWAEFADGIVMLQVGPSATADGVARQLQEALDCRDRALADVLDGQRLLLIVDDVWHRELLGTLRANLPPTVTLLATTRGVSVPGAATVPVGAVSREEAIEILARDTPRSDKLDRALASLAETLHHWALLLRLAATQIHDDDEPGRRFDDEGNPQSERTEPDAIIGRAEDLQTEFRRNPTTLDEPGPTSGDSPPPSVKVLVRRSLKWLGPERRARFELLAIYESGAAITQPMLQDLWGTSPYAAQKEIQLLIRAGLVQPVLGDRLTIELHDLVTAWLHHTCGPSDDPRHRPVHRRLAELCILPDGSPGDLTDRAERLAYHLLSAEAWDILTALPTLRWRSAFLIATGSDATFLDALDRYGHAALAKEHDAFYHAVRAWLFAAHIRALIGQLPIPLLAAMAVVRNPVAAITQAGRHPSAGEAVPAVLAAASDQRDTRFLVERAVAVARTIPDSYKQRQALDGIAAWLVSPDPRYPPTAERAAAVAEVAGWLADANPVDSALIERAVAVAATLTEDEERRSRALDDFLGWLDADRMDPAQVEQALAVAETIPPGEQRSQALADIARQLARADPLDLALIKRALAVAEAIPPGEQRGQALADIAGRLARADPLDLGLIERALAVAVTIPDDKRYSQADWRRSQTLADIAGQLARVDPEDPTLIDRALTLAETIPGEQQRSQALGGIAGRLARADPARAAALVERAVAVAEIIPGEHERSVALRFIAERLARLDPKDPALIERAVAMAETIPDGKEQNWALGGIAERLVRADPRDSGLIGQALTVVETIPDDDGRGEALAGIAALLAGAEPRDPALIGQALTVAETIPDNLWRSQALADIAGRLADIDLARTAELVERAMALAQTIPEDGWRSAAVAGIAERLADAHPVDRTLVKRVLAVAETILDEELRNEAMANVAGWLAGVDPRDPAVVRQALTVAATISGEQRNRALADIAGRIAGVDPRDPALIKRALTVARTIPRDYERPVERRWASANVSTRSEALADIAGRIAGVDPRDPALIERALTVARTIPRDYDRSQALASITKQLSLTDPMDAALIERALAVAGTIPNEAVRSETLVGIVDRLAGADPVDLALIEQAVAVAQSAWALASIAGRLARVDPRDPVLVEQALAVAGTIAADQRSQALAGIADQLAGADPYDPALIGQALSVVKTIPDDKERSKALASIAARLAGIDPTRTAALVEQALAVAGTIPNEQRNQALAGIAYRLACAYASDPTLIDRALVVAGTIPDDKERSKALASIAEQLSRTDPVDMALIDRALAVTGTIPDHKERSKALVGIADRLATADPKSPVLIDRAMAVAGTIQDDRERDIAFTRLHYETASGMLHGLSQWQLKPLTASMDMIKGFLERSDDKMIAERISLAILEVTKEFRVKV